MRGITKYFTVLLLTLCLISQSAVFVLAADKFEVNAKSSVLMEPFTKRVLVENNAHDKLAPASVTKVMTMLLIYEAVADGKIKWDDVVTISEHASNMGGSQVFLEPGQEQTVKTLTKCIAIASANDAAVAMAEYIGGSEESFVQLMNKRAKELGMNDTNFVNACGLDDDNHLTSSYDIAIMSSELITRFPDVFDYTTTWMDSITHTTRRGTSEFGLTNTNKLIKSYSGATGLKTGSTGKALYCLSGTAKRGDMQMVAVVLGSPDPKTRFEETARLLDFGFANYGVIKGDEAGTKIGAVKVFKGMEDKVDALVKNQVSYIMAKGAKGELEKKINLPDGVKAPIKKGDVVGDITYFMEGKEVGKSELIAAKDIEKTSFSNMLIKLLKDWS